MHFCSIKIVRNILDRHLRLHSWGIHHSFMFLSRVTLLHPSWNMGNNTTWKQDTIVLQSLCCTQIPWERPLLMLEILSVTSNTVMTLLQCVLNIHTMRHLSLTHFKCSVLISQWLSVWNTHFRPNLLSTLVTLWRFSKTEKRKQKSWLTPRHIQLVNVQT